MHATVRKGEILNRGRKSLRKVKFLKGGEFPKGGAKFLGFLPTWGRKCRGGENPGKPVWIYIQNNITDICIFNLCRTNIDIIIITFNIIIIIIFIEETFSYCMFFKKDLKCRLNVNHSSLIY